MVALKIHFTWQLGGHFGNKIKTWRLKINLSLSKIWKKTFGKVSDRRASFFFPGYQSQHLNSALTIWPLTKGMGWPNVHWPNGENAMDVESWIQTYGNLPRGCILCGSKLHWKLRSDHSPGSAREFAGATPVGFQVRHLCQCVLLHT